MNVQTFLCCSLWSWGGGGELEAVPLGPGAGDRAPRPGRPTAGQMAAGPVTARPVRLLSWITVL